MTDASEQSEIIGTEEYPPLRAVILTVRPREVIGLLNSLRTREAFAVIGFCGMFGDGLEVPESARVTGVNYCPFSDRFTIRVEDESFPEVPEATEIPRYAVTLKAKVLPELADD